MTGLVVVMLAAAAASVAMRPSARRRLGELTGPRPQVHDGASSVTISPTAVTSGVGGVCVLVYVDGWPGVVAGVVTAVSLHRVVSRLEPRALRRRRERMAADLPIAVDLLAACLLAGRPPADAVRSVAVAVGGPLADDLGVVAARLSLGGDPVTVWRELAVGGPLEVLGRAMARSLESGAPLAEGLTRLAEDLRRIRRGDAQQQARSVGVRAAAPLGLCFLPAFVLVGIVPTVVGSFSEVLSW